ncbi:hypothetical protein S40285_05684 [Stachybotrys chlorohalonatus IBT 40285]|uniref:Thioredoxin domain-containing protein n=1 Tax=Stachybotrys chlorohalonatus (strain IBT 40285) TaxID=1283841 RepID=A0A084QZX8_STAC4|nr:hypothetical protein S40285_05684 [Stachybotrys chlorohalonata IBT 40285]
MPIITDFTIPKSPEVFCPPQDTFFIIFTASKDPATGQPWCPDVRAALPHLQAAFTAGDCPQAAIVEVGQKPEWKNPKNAFRTNWNIDSVPTLARYQGAGEHAKETGRLVEGEILDGERLKTFVSQST